MPRRIETVIAWFTLAALVIYVPGETYVSLPRGLSNPFYLVDLIAMLLMLWGAMHSLRARPRSSPGLLCGAYGWAPANGWRATFGRLAELQSGGKLECRTGEMLTVGIAAAIALGLFVILRMLTALNSSVRSS